MVNRFRVIYGVEMPPVTSICMFKKVLTTHATAEDHKKKSSEGKWAALAPAGSASFGECLFLVCANEVAR